MMAILRQTEAGLTAITPADTMDKVKSLLRRLLRASSRTGGPYAADELGLPCAVCGAPATGWAVSSSARNGAQVIDAMAACEAHQVPEELTRSKAG